MRESEVDGGCFSILVPPRSPGTNLGSSLAWTAESLFLNHGLQRQAFPQNTHILCPHRRKGERSRRLCHLTEMTPDCAEPLNFVFQFMYTLGICLIIELIGGVVALIFRNQVGLGRIYQPHACRALLCAPWAVKLGVRRGESRAYNSLFILLGRWARKRETREQEINTGDGRGLGAEWEDNDEIMKGGLPGEAQGEQIPRQREHLRQNGACPVCGPVWVHLADGRERRGGMEGGAAVPAIAGPVGSQGPRFRRWEFSPKAAGSLCRVMWGE